MEKLKWFIVLIISLLYLGIKLNGGIQIGGGNDSNKYHQYATGTKEKSPNVWPKILRFLNQNGLYSRTGVSVFLFGCFLTVALLLAPQIIKEKSTASIFSIWLLTYPTFFNFTTDMYRDVFLVFIFFLGLIGLQQLFIQKKRVRFFSIILLIFGLSFFLYELRNYLGFAIIVALVASFSPIKGRWFYLVPVIYLLGLIFLKELEILNPILKYRGVEGFKIGDSTFGIGLLNLSTWEFLVNYLKSYFFQVFGLYLNSWKAILVFIFETIPFTVFLVYSIRNHDLFSQLEWFLFYFFIVYTGIWTLGNDNLGTAVRLRLLSYISIAIIAFRIYAKKQLELV
jgi:hypothetical protein